MPIVGALILGTVALQPPSSEEGEFNWSVLASFVDCCGESSSSVVLVVVVVTFQPEDILVCEERRTKPTSCISKFLSVERWLARWLATWSENPYTAMNILYKLLTKLLRIWRTVEGEFSIGVMGFPRSTK